MVGRANAVLLCYDMVIERVSSWRLGCGAADGGHRLFGAHVKAVITNVLLFVSKRVFQFRLSLSSLSLSLSERASLISSNIEHRLLGSVAVEYTMVKMTTIYFLLLYSAATKHFISRVEERAIWIWFGKYLHCLSIRRHSDWRTPETGRIRDDL